MEYSLLAFILLLFGNIYLLKTMYDMILRMNGDIICIENRMENIQNQILKHHYPDLTRYDV